MKTIVIMATLVGIALVALVAANCGELVSVGLAASMAVAKKQQRAEDILASSGPEAAVDYCEGGPEKHSSFSGTFWTTCTISAEFRPTKTTMNKQVTVVTHVTKPIIVSKSGYEISNATVSARVWDHDPIWELRVAPMLEMVGL